MEVTKQEPGMTCFATVKSDSAGYYLEFPEGFLEGLGWKAGDVVEWQEGLGGWTLAKKKNPEFEWVLVETVSTFRQRYMVQVPKGKKEYAEDTVAMNESKEFSQQHIGENIISSRVVSFEDAISMFQEDNDWATTWDTGVIMKNAFTTWEEANGK